MALPRAFANDYERRPIGGMGIASALADQSKHRTAHSLRAPDVGIGLQLIEGLGDELDELTAQCETRSALAPA
jgi:hypothetical protein